MKLLCLDCESTGVDVFEDRIVTVFAGVLEDGGWVEKIDLLIDPGIEIPEGASEVHGISTEYAQLFGQYPPEALSELADFLDDYRDLPWVVVNANYDFSLIDAEFQRHLNTRLDLTGIQIYDPLVMDRHHDRYRRGKRKLVNLAEQYGVPVDESLAHDASYDCWLGGHVTLAILAKYGDCTVAEQAQWQEDWRAGFEEYLRKSDPTATVEKGWPMRVKEET